MGFEGFGLGEAKVRASGGEWIGPGNHRLELLVFKQNKGDTFGEFRVMSTRDRGSNKTSHQAGDKVSIKWATGGTGKTSEMALVDLKTFLWALVSSCGKNPVDIKGEQWTKVADNALVGKAAGALVDCGAWYPVDKKTGEVIEFTRVTWSPTEASPPKPELFTGFGFDAEGGTAAAARPAPSASAPPARPGAAKPPEVDPKKRAEVLDALNEWKNEGRMTRDAVLAPASDYYTWGVGVVGASVYAELVAQVFDLPPGM